MAVNPYLSSSGSSNLGLGGNAYGGSNPYLQKNIDATMGDVTRNYQMAIAPQRASAMARSGSFGNSGQQQMQLEDQRNLGQTLGNISNQMRSADYAQQQQMYQWDQGNRLANRIQDQNYALGNRGLDVNERIANQANQTQRYGIDTSSATQRYGTDINAQTARYGTDVAAQTATRGQDLSTGLGYAGLENQSNIAGMQNETALRGQDVNERIANAQNATQRYGVDTNAATQRYGTDANTALGYAGLNNQLNIAGMNNDTQRYGVDVGADTARRGQDINQDIANTQNLTTQRGQDLNYELGTVQNENAAQQNANQLYLGNQANTTTQRGQDINQGIANAQNQLGYAGLNNQLNIANLGNETQLNIAGMQNELGYAGLENQSNIANAQNLTTQRGQDINQSIANEQNLTTQRGQDQNYDLGVARNANDATANANTLALGTERNANDLALGNARNANDATANANNLLNYQNNYNLGLGQNQIASDTLDFNINQGNFDNNLAGANFGLGIADRQLIQDQLAIDAGQTIQNQPLDYYQQFNNTANAAGSGGSQVAVDAQGNPILGGVAGANLGLGYQNYIRPAYIA